MKKKVVEVVNNNPANTSLKLGKKKYEFKNNRFFVDDLEEGKELQSRFGIGTGNDDAAINEVELDYTGGLHKYFFQGGIRKRPPPTEKEMEQDGYTRIAPGRYRKVYG
jgi:hypothetical protein